MLKIILWRNRTGHVNKVVYFVSETPSYGGVFLVMVYFYS